MENPTPGPRTAKRRAATTRARKKLLVAMSMLSVALYTFGSLGIARAAGPGSFALGDGLPRCYPVASVVVRVGALSSGPGKSNIVSATWTGGGMTVVFQPVTIDQSQYANAGPNDTITVSWDAQQGPDLGSWTATLDASLSWVWPKANTKEVAHTTGTRSC
jgi:hypothetical protein